MFLKHKVMVVEDHTLLRQGLISIISASDNFEVIAEADNGRDAIRLSHSTNPELILMDLSMPDLNGIEAIIEIKKRSPQIKIIVLTIHNAEEYVKQALKAGVEGYVLKNSSGSELLFAMNSVLNENSYLSREISQHVVNCYLSEDKSKLVSSNLSLITHREREILKLVAETKSNKDIARHLYISVKTVEKHRSNLMKKLDMHNSAALTIFAMKIGLIEISEATKDFM